MISEKTKARLICSSDQGWATITQYLPFVQQIALGKFTNEPKEKDLIVAMANVVVASILMKKIELDEVDEEEDNDEM